MAFGIGKSLKRLGRSINREFSRQSDDIVKTVSGGLIDPKEMDRLKEEERIARQEAEKIKKKQRQSSLLREMTVAVFSGSSRLLL